MWRPLVRPLIRGLVRSLVGSVTTVIVPALKRWVYNFDGVDDRGGLAFKAINVDGDNTFEFWSPPDFTLNGAIISQNISTSGNLREFQFGIDAGGAMYVGFGGTYTTVFTVAQGLKTSTKYGVTLLGTTCSIFEGGLNGTFIRSQTFSKGSAREPTARTLINSRGNGEGSFGQFSKGVQRDVKINGVLWPIADRNQPIQLPLPTGLGIELITQTVLENPHSMGNQWTYLGGGRWQYVGDGSANALQFINTSVQPTAGFVEFEVESITGVMRCYSATSQVGVFQSNPVFNQTGVFRHFVTDRNSVAPSSLFVFQRQVTGQVATCVIKNISFKSMSTSAQVSSNLWTSPTANTLTTNTPTAVSASVNSDFLAVQKALEGLVVGNTYTIRITSDASAFYGVNLAGTSLFAGTGIQNLTRTFIATSTSVLLSMDSASASSGSLTITSFERVTCNPLTLTNTTPERWEEVLGELPKTRFVYNFDGVDDRGQLATRAINPDGNIDIEFRTGNVVPPVGVARCIVDQSITATFTAKEFYLQINTSGRMQITHGGSFLSSHTAADPIKPNTVYRVTLIGNVLTYFQNGVAQIINITRGVAREPTAVTKICAWSVGSSHSGYYSGELQYIKINDVLWKLDAVGSNTQPSIPAGNDMTLINTTPDRWTEVLE